jgi:hypothetical protein
MKAKKKLSNSASAQTAKANSNDEVELATKKLWLSLIFCAGLIFMSASLHAEEQQKPDNPSIQPPGSIGQAGNEGIKAPGAEKQGAGSVLAPPTGLRIIQNEEEMNENTGQGNWRGTSPDMGKGATSGSEPIPRDTTVDTEDMNTSPAPNTENINKDTVGPGGDNMMRDAIPGGSGLKRE